MPESSARRMVLISAVPPGWIWWTEEEGEWRKAAPACVEPL